MLIRVQRGGASWRSGDKKHCDHCHGLEELSFDAHTSISSTLLRARLKPSEHDPTIWVTSTQALAQLLSAENIGLLKTIQETHPQSVSELARTTGRQQGNLSRTLTNMSQYGLVSLTKGANNQVRPVANATCIEVEIDLAVAG